MNRPRLLLLCALLCLGPAVRADSRTDATLVVYNSADPLSKDLAEYYAAQRQIPGDRVIGLACPVAEEIARELYEKTIAQPLRQLFDERDWWDAGPAGTPATRNSIRYVALIRAMPLRIAPSPGFPGDGPGGPAPLGNRNEASVDSELAVLGLRTSQISGAVKNPYFRSYKPATEAGLGPFMLVSRLDGPTGGDVKRMIDDSLAAEKNGLWGFAYIDIRNIEQAGYKEGDDWLRAAARESMEAGIPVVMGYGGSLFPQSYPMTDAAFYYGWYTEQVTGPFLDPGFRFVPGAVACHIHSFSASTVRQPRAHWVGPLVAAGAAAVLGNVYEPYLGLTANLDIFQERLLAGFTFAEASYMATPALSWMTVSVGDPLYRPMRLVNDISVAPPPQFAAWQAYRNGAQTWFDDGIPAGEKALRTAGQEWKSGMIYEGLASLMASANRLDDALEASQQARRFYGEGPDNIRVLYRETNLLFGRGEDRRALRFLGQALREHRREPHAQALVDLRNELDPPPSPPLPPNPVQR